MENSQDFETSETVKVPHQKCATCESEIPHKRARVSFDFYRCKNLCSKCNKNYTGKHDEFTKLSTNFSLTSTKTTTILSFPWFINPCNNNKNTTSTFTFGNQSCNSNTTSSAFNFGNQLCNSNTTPTFKFGNQFVGGGDGVTPPPPPKSKKCLCCKRKVGFLGFRCRCGGLFCGSHRYPEEHDCDFDYKRMGRQILEKENPIVNADKLHDRV